MGHEAAAYRPALLRDAYELADHIRTEDALEAEALGLPVEDALVDGVEARGEAVTAYDRDGVISIHGVALRGLLEGQVWMVCTPRVTQYKRQLVVDGRETLERWKKKYTRLFNVVHSKNEPAIQFLLVMGFELGDQVKMDNTGEVFTMFQMLGVGGTH